MRNCVIMVLKSPGGGQGAGAHENKGRERAGSGIYTREGSGSRNKEGDSL